MSEKILEKKIKNLERDLSEVKNQNEEINQSIEFIKQILTKNMEKTNLCPICGEISSFDDFGYITRHNVKCPYCGSLERHRLVYLFFERKVNELFKKNISVLHFAPEPLFYNIFKTKDNIDYYPVDLCPENYESVNINIREKVDMQNIPFENEKFDLIYNSHVLEHVPNDIKAMRELYRVLKPNGVCVILVPIFNIEKTYENEKFDTPELRLKHFGQDDHVRKYGLDFKDRLKSVGFHVDVIKDETILNKYELKNDTFRLSGEVFVCTK